MLCWDYIHPSELFPDPQNTICAKTHPGLHGTPSFIVSHLSHNASVIVYLYLYPPCSNRLPPPYSGRLTFRGTLAPSEVTYIRPKLWIVRPGVYSLDSWRLETEVLETPTPNPQEDVRIRCRYLQEPTAGNGSHITVCDVQTS